MGEEEEEAAAVAAAVAVSEVLEALRLEGGELTGIFATSPLAVRGEEECGVILGRGLGVRLRKVVRMGADQGQVIREQRLELLKCGAASRSALCLKCDSFQGSVAKVRETD